MIAVKDSQPLDDGAIADRRIIGRRMTEEQAGVKETVNAQYACGRPTSLIK